MSYLTDYKEIDGGYVAFGGNPKGGKITGKCTIRTGTKDNNNAGQARKEKEPSKYYILLPLWTADPPFPQEPKNQEEKDIVNNTNRVNVVSSTLNAASNEVNDVGRKLSIKLPDGLNMLKLEDISIFEDSNKDVFGAEVDLNNLESTFQVSPIPTTRIHKIIPLNKSLEICIQLLKQGEFARIEAIRLFLAYASFKDFVVYQMDVKSAFLYGKIEEECKKQTVVENFTTKAEFIQTFLDKQLDGIPTYKEKYDVSFHTKKVFANMKRIGKGFSGKETLLFPTKKFLDLEDELKRTKTAKQTKIDILERESDVPE
nr:putative ribonuclease H-like domain-containing protein [Tanacetum cinerariifolium]